MAIKLFILLNAMGAVFLLYVLAQFWKEARQTKTDVRPDEFDFMREERPTVLVVTQLIAHGTHGSGSVIPLQLRAQASADKQNHRRHAAAIYKMEVKRYSTR